MGTSKKGDRATEDITGLKLDKWQREVLEHDGNVCIRSGRQVGKSTVIAIKTHKFAMDNPGTVTLVIAASQRQSSLLFSKIKQLFDEEEDIYDGIPTQTHIRLKNGSVIYCLPTGKSGIYIRGYTVDLLIADEAAYIPESVWLAVMPMLAVSRKQRGQGNLILISTPFGKGGFFYECFGDPDFRSWHISSEKCKRIPKKFLLKEKKRLSKVEYAQEYLGEFRDEWNQFFPTKLIRKCETFIGWDFKKNYDPRKSYYLGVDIARYGTDDTAYVVVELHKNLKAVKIDVTKGRSTTETIGYIKKMHDKWNFKRIFIDDAGVGGGVYDALADELGKSRVIGLNNAKRTVDKLGSRKKVLKEDMYSNVLVLLENFADKRVPSLELRSDLRLRRSMRNMTYEYSKDKILRIYGKDSHLSEALVRACWCIKQKGLKLFIA